MLAFLFLASNAKHILQCISDTLKTTLNTSWRCFETCTPDKTKLNHLPPRRLTRKCVQKSRQSHFYFFEVDNMESPYGVQHLKLLDSCNLVSTDHTFPESPPHCPPLSIAITMIVGLLPSSTCIEDRRLQALLWCLLFLNLAKGIL